MNLREALLKAGIAALDKVQEENDAQLFRDKMTELANNDFRRQQEDKRKAKFMRGFREVYRSALKNPSTSGSASHEARFKDASGSDLHKAYTVSKPATPFGEPGRSGKVKR